MLLPSNFQLNFFKIIVEHNQTIHDRLVETNNQLEHAGYHIQVEKKDNSAHLFYNSNGRKPVYHDNGKFTVDDKEFSKDELLKLIESEPEKFSPDVMTRPILQSYLFPVVSQKGGAAEIAYLAQLNKLFDLFELQAPLYKARPTATIVERRMEKLLGEMDIKFEELFGDIEDVVNRILTATFPQRYR